MSLIGGTEVRDGVIVKFNDQSGFMFVSDNGQFIRIAISENVQAITWGDTDNFSQDYVEILRQTHQQISVEEFDGHLMEADESMNSMLLKYKPKKELVQTELDLTE